VDCHSRRFRARYVYSCRQIFFCSKSSCQSNASAHCSKLQACRCELLHLRHSMAISLLLTSACATRSGRLCTRTPLTLFNAQVRNNSTTAAVTMILLMATTAAVNSTRAKLVTTKPLQRLSKKKMRSTFENCYRNKECDSYPLSTSIPEYWRNQFANQTVRILRPLVQGYCGAPASSCSSEASLSVSGAAKPKHRSRLSPTHLRQETIICRNFHLFDGEKSFINATLAFWKGVS
jgi:hypothetical protein